ncbi:MAG: hypothetical protein E7430_07015 [Ruminococcaceae bacterium]|nr:hypothetical protein [Oscillospiraceae bacterium]
MTAFYSYLGANSPVGFHSFYQQAMEEAGESWIIKGSPGCGKSTFMKYIAEGLAADNIELFKCSSDPQSLDGIMIPSVSVAYFDGTFPHVLEPQCPGAVGNYINLGDFIDHAAIKSRSDELVSLFAQYKAHYPEAYTRLNTARELLDDRLALICKSVDFEKLCKRTRGIISREIGKPGKNKGTLHRRFLSSISFMGHNSDLNQIPLHYERVYRLESYYELTRFVTPLLLDAALAAGKDVIACYDPMNPNGSPEHILIPQLSLAFVTSSDISYNGPHDRNIRLDSYIKDLKTDRARIRFNKKTASCLIDEAVQSMAHAKAIHDDIEQIYKDYVDFEGVMALAQNHLDRLLKMI